MMQDIWKRTLSYNKPKSYSVMENIRPPELNLRDIRKMSMRHFLKIHNGNL